MYKVLRVHNYGIVLNIGIMLRCLAFVKMIPVIFVYNTQRFIRICKL